MSRQIEPGSVVILKAFDDIPEHLFKVLEVQDDLLTGVALTGPLAGNYGEPDRSQVLRVIWKEGPQ